MRGCLLEAALGASRAEILADPRRPLAKAEADAFDAHASPRRAAAASRSAAFSGARAFGSIELTVTSDVLTPRPDTETRARRGSVARLAKRRDSRSRRGLGRLAAGALIAERPAGWGVGADISAAAVAVARRNAEALGLAARAAFVLGRLGRAVRLGRL